MFTLDIAVHHSPAVFSGRVYFVTRCATASSFELILKCASLAAGRLTSNWSWAFPVRSPCNEKVTAPPASRKSGVSPIVRTSAPLSARKIFAYRLDSERIRPALHIDYTKEEHTCPRPRNRNRIANGLTRRSREDYENACV